MARVCTICTHRQMVRLSEIRCFWRAETSMNLRCKERTKEALRNLGFWRTFFQLEQASVLGPNVETSRPLISLFLTRFLACREHRLRLLVLVCRIRSVE